MERKDSISITSSDEELVGWLYQLPQIVAKLHERWKSEVSKSKIDLDLKMYIPSMFGASENVIPVLRFSGVQMMRDFLSGQSPLMLLLGDSGSGKTLFGEWFVNNIWSECASWVPFFIHLPNLEIKKNFLDEYLKKFLGENEVLILKKYAKFLLILDSFDEMPIEHYKDNLYQLGELCTWSNIKVVISCRSEAIQKYNAFQLSEIFAANPQKENQPLLKFYIQFFDIKTQVPEYIDLWKRVNVEEVIHELDYLKLFEELPGLAGMVTNPFILWAAMFALGHIFKLHPEQFHPDLPKVERYYFTRLALFDAFTEAWFERQARKLLENGAISPQWRKTIAYDFRLYCEQLSNYLWQTKRNSIIYDPNDKEGWGKYFNENALFNNDADKPLKYVRKGALLRAIGDNSWALIHQSLMEYFSASCIYKSAADRVTVTLGLEINAVLITNDPSRIRLGVDFIENDPKFEKALWDILHESQHEERVATASANAFTLLVAANKSFANKVLPGIRVRYASGVGGNFESADFMDADFRDVDLSRAFLANAKLSGSCTDGMLTGELIGEAVGSVVKDCVFSHDGQYYVVVAEKTIVVYNAISHEKMSAPISFSAWLSSKAVRRCSISTQLHQAIATFDNDKGIKFINLKDGKVFPLFTDSGSRFYGLGMSSNGLWAFSYGDEMYRRDMFRKCVKKWNCETHECVATSRAPMSWGVILISADGNSAFITRNDNNIEFWVWVYLDNPSGTGKVQEPYYELVYQLDKHDFHQVYKLGNHEDYVNALVLSADEKWLYSASNDKKIKKWNLITRSCVATWQGHTAGVRALALSSDDLWLISGSDDKTIKRWNCVTGECTQTWYGHEGAVNAVAISTDMSWVLSGSSDQTIKRWEFARKPVMVRDGESINYSGVFAFIGNEIWVCTKSSDNKINKLNCETGECIGSLKDKNPLSVLVANSDDKWLLACFKNGAIERRDALTNDCLAKWDRGPIPIVNSRFMIPEVHKLNSVLFEGNPLVLSTNGAWALSIDESGSIIKWDTVTGNRLAIWVSAAYNTTAMTINHQDTWAIRANDDGEIKKFDCMTGECIATWKGHKRTVWALAVSKNGDFAYSGSAGCIIRKWNAVTGQVIAKWDGHKIGFIAEMSNSYFNFVSNLALSRDGRWLLSCDNKGTLLIWDTKEKGKECARYSLAVNKLSWSPKDDSLIIMKMNDGSISAWTFRKETVSIHLKWRTKPWGVHAHNCQLSGVHGLEQKHKQVFSQKGAKVQISSKSSEHILAQRTFFPAYREESRDRRSAFDNSYIVSRSASVITVGRNKERGRGHHAFMIVENVEEVRPRELCYRIRRIDFFLELRHSELPKSATEPNARDIFGQGVVEIGDKSFNEAKTLAEMSHHCSAHVSAEDCEKLLVAINKDQAEKLSYCKPGSGPIYGMFSTREAAEHHNCVSWIRKHLEAVGVDLIKGSLKDFFVEDPRGKILSHTNNVNNDNNSSM